MEEKKLIAFVMNYMADRNFESLDDARSMLRAQIENSSNPSLVVAKVRQEIDSLATDSFVRADETSAGLVANVQEMLARLASSVNGIVNVDGHVNDLLLLLRGVQIIRDIQLNMQSYERMAIVFAQHAELIAGTWDDNPKDMIELKTTYDNYLIEVDSHAYTLPYVKVYVDACAAALRVKWPQLPQANQDAKKTLLGKRDHVQISRSFVAKLRL